MQAPDAQSQYPAELFRRQDESDDRLFYAEPRLVTHIDDYAIEAIRAYLREALPPHGTVLDLMSSWRSHLPYDLPMERVIGLGLNAVELDENPQLTDRVAHDLNADPNLPLEANSVGRRDSYRFNPIHRQADCRLSRGQPHPEGGRGVPCHLLQPNVPHQGGGGMAVYRRTGCARSSSAPTSPIQAAGLPPKRWTSAPIWASTPIRCMW